MQTETDPPKVKIPEGLRGRRAREFYRELLPQIHTSGPLRADIATLLAAYAATVARIGEKPNSPRAVDLDCVQRLGRLLGLKMGDRTGLT